MQKGIFNFALIFFFPSDLSDSLSNPHAERNFQFCPSLVAPTPTEGRFALTFFFPVRIIRFSEPPPCRKEFPVLLSHFFFLSDLSDSPSHLMQKGSLRQSLAVSVPSRLCSLFAGVVSSAVSLNTTFHFASGHT